MKTEKKHHILVVEDDIGTRELIANLLTSESCIVIEANDAAEAFWAVSKDKPEGLLCLSIVDIMLPDINGLRLIHYLHKRHNHIPILAISATLANLDAALSVGAKAALAKPFEIESLTASSLRICKHQRGS